MEPPFYTVEILDPNGNKIDTCENPISIAAARSFNASGSCTIEIPRDWSTDIFRHNTRFKLWRVGYDYQRRLFGGTVWFLQDFHNQVSADKFVIECDDSLAIAAKRVVAYTGETVYADKTLEAYEEITYSDFFRIDNLMRAYIRENMGEDVVDTTRENELISIESNRNLAPYGEFQAGFAELGQVLQNLANMSAQLGTELFYDFIPNDNGTFTFKVWKDVRGVNRTESSNDPLILTDDGGALDEITLTKSYRDSRTVCYALGEGSGAAQLYTKIEDVPGAYAYPFARSEFVYNANEISAPDVLELQGQAALYGRRPRLIASARLVDNSAFRYDEQATYGDRITIQVESESIDVNISSVNMNYGEQGENLDIRLSGSRPL